MTAINFPDSPSNGDTHVVGGVIYTYDSTETKWKTTINSNAFLPLTGGTVSGNIVLGGEIQHDGDTDTNISFDADTIKFDTAGSERFRVDSSGRVGIGTPSPSTGLEVATGSIFCSSGGLYLNELGGTSSVYLSYGGGNPILMNGANGALRFGTNNTERARIDSSGDFKFNSGYGSVATAYGCRAWVNFNGTGAVAKREDGNISSVTDNATGDYTLSFSTALVDANYSVVASCGTSASGNPPGIVSLFRVNSTGTHVSPTTSAFRITTSSVGGVAQDGAWVCVAVIR